MPADPLSWREDGIPATEPTRPRQDLARVPGGMARRARPARLLCGTSTCGQELSQIRGGRALPDACSRRDTLSDASSRRAWRASARPVRTRSSLPPVRTLRADASGGARLPDQRRMRRPDGRSSFPAVESRDPDRIDRCATVCGCSHHSIACSRERSRPVRSAGLPSAPFLNDTFDARSARVPPRSTSHARARSLAHVSVRHRFRFLSNRGGSLENYTNHRCSSLDDVRCSRARVGSAIG
jgi:hypothetical protein